MTLPEAARSFAARQNALHETLGRYVNRGAAPGAGRRQAARLARAYAALAEALPAGEPASPPEVFDVPPYAGTCAAVHAMARYLWRHLAGEVYAALVHGSLGSGEEVPYSDFDALVVLRDATMRDPRRLRRAARRLRRAQQIMRAYDPLQHHGWFVLTEGDLRAYCDAYFPRALLGHAAALWPAAGCTLALVPRAEAGEHAAAFGALARAVLRALAAPPRSLFGLKSLLSRFMLLPALYVQARDGRGVWKKDSFALARADFEPGVWAAMEAVSEIRLAWSYPLPAWRRVLMTRPGAWGGRLQKRFSPPVPPALAARLGPALWHDMGRLVRGMQQAHVAHAKGHLAPAPEPPAHVPPH